MAEKFFNQDEGDKHLNCYQDADMVDHASEDQRVLSFFQLKFNYAHPYHVLPDEAFYVSYVGIHGLDALHSLSQYLHGQVLFLMTRCCYSNIVEQGAVLCPIQVLECRCKGKNFGEQCIHKLLKSRQFIAKKEKLKLHIFLATDDDTNFLSIEKEYPIIGGKDGVLDLSMTMGALSKFMADEEGVKGADAVWKEAQVAGTKKVVAAGTATKKESRAVQGLMADARKTAPPRMASADAIEAQVAGTKKVAAAGTATKKESRAVQGLMADARKTAPPRMASADARAKAAIEAQVAGTKKVAAAGTATKKESRAVQGLMADARKTAPPRMASADARAKAAIETDVKDKKLLAAIKSSRAKRGSEEPSENTAAKRSKKSQHG